MHTREARLRQTVLDALAFDPSIDATRIRVIVVNDIVNLKGYVGSYAEKVAAEHLVQRVKGVRGLMQEIKVRCPEDRRCQDDEIAERARKVIAWHAMLPDNAIEVAVRKGCITLSGVVEWQFEKLAAADAIGRLSGVIGLNNAIVVRPRNEVTEIKPRIEAALGRTAELDARRIRVQVSGCSVQLEGKVDAWYNRHVAECLAWAVTGVASVEDRLIVRRRWIGR